MEGNSLMDLAILAFGAGVGGVIAKVLKLPLVLGYMAAGLVLTHWGLGMGHTLGQIGIMFLLFIAGLELPIGELKKVGRGIVVAALGQMTLTVLVTSGCLWLVGFRGITLGLVSLALGFASTIVVVKNLSERSDLQSLYGKVTVGYLLVQDFMAVLILALLGIWADKAGWVWGVVGIIIKLVVVIGAALVMGEVFKRKIMNFIAVWPELLFVLSVGWCLVVGAIVGSPWVGLGFEIGGFVAGLSLANVMEKSQIAAKVKTLRDFFLLWFFVSLGGRIGVGWEQVNWWLVGLFVLISTFVNPIGMILGLMFMGYGKRIVFWAAMGTIALSEFSLIIWDRGVHLGLLSPGGEATLTVVMAVSMIIYGYVTNAGEKLYSIHKRWWKPKGHGRVGEELPKEKCDIVIFGHNRVGKKIRPILEKENAKVLVVDFNPTVVEDLKKEGVNAVYGDMADWEIYGELGLSEAQMIVSTVPDKSDSLLLLEQLRGWKKKPFIVLTADDVATAAELYKQGADFVLVPHAVGADYLGHLLKRGVEAVKSEAVLHQQKMILT